jgi:serine/threonine-protein kinase RsbW
LSESGFTELAGKTEFHFYSAFSVNPEYPDSDNFCPKRRVAFSKVVQPARRFQPFRAGLRMLRKFAGTHLEMIDAPHKFDTASAFFPLLMESVTIQIPSMIDNIRIIESFIDNAKDIYNLDDDIYGNILIAVTESVNNAIRHGNGEDPSKNVSLSMFLEDESVRFVVEDQGPGFDYHHLPDPTAPETLEKIGGRGIYLMRHLSDEVHFRNEGRQVELVFYFN